MKILIVNDVFYPEQIYGSGIIAFNQALELAKNGHEIQVFCSTINKEGPFSVKYEGLKINRVYSLSHERWREYTSIYQPRVAKEFIRILKNFKPNIVHFHNVHTYLCFYLFKLSKREGAKTYLTAHDVNMFYGYKLTKFINPQDLTIQDEFNYKVNWWEIMKVSKRRFNPFRRKLIRYYLKYIDQIISVSDALKEALKQNGIRNIVTIHNGINTNNFQTSDYHIQQFKQKFNLENRKIIFYCGKITGQKGVLLMIDVLKEVYNSIKNVVLVVTSQPNQQIINLAKQAGLDNKIVFTGWLNKDEITAPFFASHLVITPSVCFDSFPTVNLEAMAASKPVVATCFGGSRELVIDGQTGFVVNPYDIKNTANKIILLLTDEMLLQKFGQAGFNRVKEHFSLDKQINKILELYDR